MCDRFGLGGPGVGKFGVGLVDAGRITTVSYGKERPVALGSDEESWARNRRAVTVTID